MPQNYTIISFDEGSPLRCTMRRLGVIETHLHEVFELDMVLSGSCQVTARRPLRPGPTICSPWTPEYRMLSSARTAH